MYDTNNKTQSKAIANKISDQCTRFLKSFLLRNLRQLINVYFGAVSVCLLIREEPLWLVWVRLEHDTRRRRGGEEPRRLLTSEIIATEKEC